jgi:hypothetical protein
MRAALCASLIAGSAEVRVASGLSPRTSLKVAVATLPISPACAASTCRPSSDDVLESSTRATARGSSQAALESGATGSGSDTAAPAPAPATASDTSTSAGITLSDNPAAGSSWATYVGGSYSTYTPSNTSLILPAVPDDDPTVQTVQLLVGSACPPSSLGYVCSQQVADSVKLHYSYRTAQPGNSCTQGAGFDVALGEETDVMHFAIESTLQVQPCLRAFAMTRARRPAQAAADNRECESCTQGYAAIGFPLRPGSMTPADAVVGSVDDAAGSIQVDTYRLTWADPAGVTAVPPQWATGLGAVRTTSGQSKVTIMCFSRPLAANGTLQAVLQPAGTACRTAAGAGKCRRGLGAGVFWLTARLPCLRAQRCLSSGRPTHHPACGRRTCCRARSRSTCCQVCWGCLHSTRCTLVCRKVSAHSPRSTCAAHCCCCCCPPLLMLCLQASRCQ